MDFTLFDESHLVVVDEFDRIFDGDDMACASRVDAVQQGGERRGFTGARGADEEDEALAARAEVGDGFRNSKCFDARYLCRNDTERCGDGAFLVEAVDTETVVAFFPPPVSNPLTESAKSISLFSSKSARCV